MADLTLKELADKLGVTEGAVSYWESGKSSPRMKKIVMMAKIFNIDPSILIFGEVEPNEEDKIISEIIKAINNNEELKDLLYRAIMLEPETLFRIIKVLAAMLPEGEE